MSSFLLFAFTFHWGLFNVIFSTFHFLTVPIFISSARLFTLWQFLYSHVILSACVLENFLFLNATTVNSILFLSFQKFPGTAFYLYVSINWSFHQYCDKSIFFTICPALLSLLSFKTLPCHSFAPLSSWPISPDCFFQKYISCFLGYFFFFFNFSLGYLSKLSPCHSFSPPLSSWPISPNCSRRI